MKLISKGLNDLQLTLAFSNPELVSSDSGIVVTLQGSNLIVTGGNDKNVYNFVLSSGGQLYDYALWVDYNLSADAFPEGSFDRLVGSIQAGGSAIGQANFAVDATTDLLQSTVTWSVVDQNGQQHSAGQCFDFAITNTSYGQNVKAQSVVWVPSNIAPSTFQNSYQILYRLNTDQGQQLLAESLSVLGLTDFPLGTQDAVELINDTVSCTIVLPARFSGVGATLYCGNDAVPVTITISDPIQTNAGFLYTASFDSTDLGGSLEPYSCVWDYSQNSQVFRETSRVWLLTPSLMRAIPEVQAMVMKAHTTINGAPDTLFDPPVILNWLQQGRDLFNGTGANTWFDMTNATGAVRVFWLRATEILALRAQALAEGEKAFNFQGSSVQLEVDRATIYNQTADSLQSQFDNDVKPFKQQLATRNMVRGDGDYMGFGSTPFRPRMGSLGITRTPINYWGGAFTWPGPTANPPGSQHN